MVMMSRVLHRAGWRWFAMQAATFAADGLVFAGLCLAHSPVGRVYLSVAYSIISSAIASVTVRTFRVLIARDPHDIPSQIFIHRGDVLSMLLWALWGDSLLARVARRVKRGSIRFGAEFQDGPA